MNEANIPNDKRDAQLYLKGYLDALVLIGDDIGFCLSISNQETVIRKVNSMICLVSRKLNGDCDE